MATQESKGDDSIISAATNTITQSGVPDLTKYNTIIEQQLDLGSTILDDPIKIIFPNEAIDTNETLKVKDIIHFQSLKQLLFETNESGLIKYLDDSVREIPILDISKSNFDTIINLSKLFYQSSSINNYIVNNAKLYHPETGGMDGTVIQFTDNFGTDIFEEFEKIFNSDNGPTHFRTLRFNIYSLHGFSDEVDAEKYKYSELCGVVEAYLAMKCTGKNTDEMREILHDPASDYTPEDLAAIDEGYNIFDETEMAEFRKKCEEKAATENAANNATATDTTSTTDAATTDNAAAPESKGEDA